MKRVLALPFWLSLQEEKKHSNGNNLRQLGKPVIAAQHQA